MLPVPLVGEEEHQIAKVPRSMIVNIIRPRLEETFELVKERIDSSGLSRAAGTRVVLTGGAWQLGGAGEMAARILGRQVRIGRPHGLRGLPDCASGPAFATAAGLLAWTAGEGRTMHDLDLEEEQPAGLFRRFVNFPEGARLMSPPCPPTATTSHRDRFAIRSRLLGELPGRP